jgi:hypothetical protein
MEKTMSDDDKRMTEQEQDEAGRVMLAAAFEALGDFPSDHDKEDADEFARCVIRALVAAAKAERNEKKRFTDAYGCNQYIKIDPHEVVASAFAAWTLGVDHLNTCPSSVIGYRFLGFSIGLSAARSMSDALDLLEDGSGFAYSARGAEYLAPKLDDK